MDTDEHTQLRISFEEYKKISNMLILHMRDYEEKNRDDGEGALRKAALVDWYIGQVEGELQSEQDMIGRINMTEKVIDRLVKVDNVLLEIEGEEADPFLVVHPNYMVE